MWLFLSGFIFGCGLCVLIGGSYILGMKQNKPKAQPVDEEQKRKQEALRKGFSELMSYDVTTALKGKR